MLGYVATAAAWGFLKSQALGLTRSPRPFHSFGVPELLEEVEFRAGLEHGLGRTILGLRPAVARLGAAALFGLCHPGNELDAALGGFLYSKAYEAHGLVGSTLTHLTHNLFVHLGGKP